MSITHLIFEASLVVQLVMLLLLVVSILSWTLIFFKYAVIKRARSAADQFERRFWSGVDLGDLYKRLSSRRARLEGMELIFESGFREFAQLRKNRNVDSSAAIEGAQRAMRVALNREIDRLENHLSFLATVGSTSPYVGLFGTVWGIMHSFMGLGAVKQATIATVAPGIAEALIATAMGLFAAIPAVVAYNRYSNDVERLISKYDIFAEEFSSILQRQTHSGSGTE
ncbi:protein TolQ [Thiohalophilus sp.]|uniref:protein TolQ n=1 Tax=Thiohalophilus sp. TaxID=3028392 RepID=UPI003976B980